MEKIGSSGVKVRARGNGARAAGERYSGPTKQGFDLDVKRAEKFYSLLGKALGKER